MPTLPNLVDSHCHLDFDSLEPELPDVVARAQAAGVARMLTICTTLAAAPSVRAIAESHAPVFWAVGTHPMQVVDQPMATVEALTRLAEHPKMVGIGETGLDYHYTAESKVVQEASFRCHIEAARQTGLPLIVHARAADDDMIRILSDEHEAGRFGCVLHCYSSGPRLAEIALGLGFYLSMSGIVTFPKSTELRAIFAAAPLDRILVETDSPYLAPPPHRGKRNEPAFVAQTARTGAELFQLTLNEFAEATTDNFYRLFSKAARWREPG